MSKKNNQVIATFYSIEELSEHIQASRSSFNSLLELYNERLGALLRDNQEAHSNDEWFKQFTAKHKGSTASKSPEKEKEASNKGKGKKDKGEKNQPGGKSSDKESSGIWFTYHGLSLCGNQPVRGEIELLFDGIGEIKEKLRLLDEAGKAVDELAKSGISGNKKYITYFSNGIPQKILIIERPTETKLEKFRYDANFLVTMLQG